TVVGELIGAKRSLAALAVLCAGLSASAMAEAEPMDPAIDRLVLDDRCRTNTGAYNDDPGTLQQVQAATGRAWCSPDHAAFKRLMAQYGFALAPTAMHSARTTGF